MVEEMAIEQDVDGRPTGPASSVRYRDFFKLFVKAKGTKEVLAIAFFLAFGVGCVVGVVSRVKRSQLPWL